MEFYDTVERTRKTLWGAYIPQSVFYIAPETEEPDTLLYYVNRGGIVKQTPEDFWINRHDTYPYTQVTCLASGRGTLTMAGKSWQLEPGMVFLLPPFMSHSYISDPTNPMGLVWLEFSGGCSAALAHRIMERSGPIFQGAVFETILNDCVEFLTKPVQGPAQTSMLVYQILLCMYTARKAEKLGSRRPADEIYAYLESHLHENLRMADVARRFGYNPSYFSTMFAQVFGLPFTKYLTRWRISKARYLLTTTDLPLDRIAASLGFYDTSHFIQRFRESEQISPSRFRRLHGESSAENRLAVLEKNK